MANFNYSGVDSQGKKVSGTIVATNEKEVRKALHSQQIRATKIFLPLSEFDLSTYFEAMGIGTGFEPKDLLNFTKQLSTMIGAGIPIMQALEILQKSEKNHKLKKAIRGIAASVEEGKTISEAMSAHRGFDKMYCSLVKAGEAGGMLDAILKKLAVHMEKQLKLRAQIKGALTYPTIVVFVGIIVIWAMMVFMIPVFVGMLKENNTKIPAITQFVMDMSAFFVAYTVYMIPGVILGGMAFKAYIKTPTGKVIWDRATMQLPIFGQIIIKGNLASFTSTFGTLLSSGVALLDALEICIASIDNVVIKNDMIEVKKKIMEGQTLTEPLGRITYFPKIITQMVKVGEQTGQMDEMLARVAILFQEEIDSLVGEMTKMIEPLIIIVLGGMVGVMLIAMYLPMFQAAG